MVFEKTIREVVDENYVYARALHYLGIDFFADPDRKLKEICLERGLDRQKVIKSFYDFDSCNRLSFQEIRDYPIELVIEYLKHAHYLFIKEKLPYIVHLARQSGGNSELSSLLPDFVEDLIRHIYEEEDSTFKYIELLTKIKKGHETAPFSKLMAFESYSLEAEYHHHQNEDELEAIRSLLKPVQADTLLNKVLMSEVRSFDREMIYHAEIENHIFFPRALALEKEVHTKISQISKLN